MVEEAVYRLPAKIIIILSALIGFGTFFGCFLIAVCLGHVHPWLPMISDCGVSTPEKYLFRIGIITTAGQLALSGICVYFYLHTVTLGGTQTSDKVILFLCLLSTACLSMVGAVNERENGTIHGVAAVTFFATYLLYILMTTFRLYNSSSAAREISSTSVAVKALIATVCTICLVGYVIVNFLKYHTATAIFEWIGTLSILSYNLSFLYEFTDELWIAAILKEQVRVQNNQPKSTRRFQRQTNHPIYTPFNFSYYPVVQPVPQYFPSSSHGSTEPLASSNAVGGSAGFVRDVELMRVLQCTPHSV